LITLEDLLTKDIEDILNDPLLSKAVVNYYSQLYVGGRLVSSCDSSKRLYLRRLHIDGLQTKKRIEMSKYQIKKGKIITHMGQVFNSNTITDAIAESYLKKFPSMEDVFIINKDINKDIKEVEKPITREVKTRKPRTKKPPYKKH
jgi:hypothetical protein